MKKITQPTKAQDIKRKWHLVDVKGKILGRISTKIAPLLMGKSKPYFTRNLDCGDYVIAVNASHILVTGKKAEQKKYYHHSGYPGGLKIKTFKELRQNDPAEIIKHAVRGMLPQNKLRDRMLKRLFIFLEEEHPYGEKFKS